MTFLLLKITLTLFLLGLPVLAWGMIIDDDNVAGIALVIWLLSGAVLITAALNLMWGFWA